MASFNQRLLQAQRKVSSVLCIGLDPDLHRIPRHLLSAQPEAEAVMAFNKAVVRATAPYACAYKLNFAFYEALGRRGYEVIQHTLACIPRHAVAIADAKRGDIGNTANKYAHAVFRTLDFDACTVAPYMGRDAVAPFLRYADKAAFVLARTSNESARDFQEIPCGQEKLFHLVARRAAAWDKEFAGNAGLVVGATSPTALRELRALCPQLPFLIPGVGAQGGTPEDIAPAFSGPVIVNSSRAVIYASPGTDFAERAADGARQTRELLAGLVPESSQEAADQ